MALGVFLMRRWPALREAADTTSLSIKVFGDETVRFCRACWGQKRELILRPDTRQNNRLEQDNDSKKSHLALGGQQQLGYSISLAAFISHLPAAR
jgi:hypothetical protein